MTTVSSGTEYDVFAGQTSNGIHVQTGGTLVAFSGGTISNTIFDGAGDVELSGGTAIGTVVQAGGLEGVFNGATDRSAFVSGGTIDDIGGTVSGAFIVLGTNNIEAGTSISTTIYSNSKETVGYYGIASGTRVNGGEEDVFGSAVDVVVSGTGVQIVGAGGISFDTVILPHNDTDFIDNREFVSSGGVASGTMVTGVGAALSVYDGGTTVSAQVLSFGLTDLSGGTAIATTLVGSESYQQLYVGTAIGTIVSSGAAENVFSGTTSNTIVLSGGLQENDGGVTINTKISNGGTGTVTNFGLASGTQIFSGGVLNVGGTASGTIVFGGGLESVTGGGASGSIVTSGGTQTISAGGMAYNATISNGAIQNDYGSANITTLNGIQFVFGTANNTTVSSGGVEVIESGGTGGFIVSAGGTFNVLAGGTATGGGVLSGGFVQDLWHDKRRHC